MAKLTLNDIGNITGNPTSAEQALNANFTLIEEAIENTLSRDGTTPNALEASLDANSHRIVNLPYALSNTEPVTLAQVMALVTGGDWTGGAGIPAVVYYQDTQPTATAQGQVWVKPNGEMYLWIGSTWVRTTDPYAMQALGLSQSNQVAIEIIQPRLVVVEQDAANHSLAIVELQNEDISLAAEISALTADLGTNSAAIITESQARASADLALASTINTLQASNAQIFIQPSAPVPGVGGVPNPIPEGSFWYDSDDGNAQYRYKSGSWQNVDNAEIDALAASIQTEQTARINADSALAVDISNLWSQRNADYAYIGTVNQARIDGDAALSQQYTNLNTTVGSLNSTVIVNNQARIDGDAANASSISSLSTTVGGLNTTVTQHTASINGIEGKYAIKIDANGYVTGFGLIATSNGSSPSSTFTVLADNFEIVTPGTAPVKPFYVSGGVTYIRNVVIEEASIGTATIGTLKLQNNSVSDVFSNTLNFLGNTVNVAVGNTYYNLTTGYGTASITMNGIPTSGSKVHIRAFFNAKRWGGTAENCQMRIRRDDGVILPSLPLFRLTADYLTYSWEWIDTAPASTTHTYTAQITRAGGGNTGAWEDIQMIGTLLKR